MKRFISGVLAVLAVAGAAGPTFGQPCAPLPGGALSWWKGDGNANDFLGARHGTLVGASATYPGVVGQSFYLGSWAHSVTASDSGLPAGNAPRTVEFWMRVDSQAIIPFKYGGSGQDNMFFVTVNGGSRAGIGRDGGSPVMGAKAVNDGIWHHIALTYDGAGTARLYVDGDLDATDARTYATTLTGTVTMGEMFVGPLDEVAIYDRALTAQEIKGLYQVGSAGKCTSAVFTIVPAALLDGVMNVPYSETLAPINGTPPYSAFTIASGTPPAGLTLSDGGLLSGTPTSPGTSSFVVQVTDSSSQIATRTYVLRIRAFTGASYTWNGTTGDWTDSARWIPNGVPGANDEANVNSGSVSVTADTQVAALNYNGGVLRGGAVLTVGTLMNWTGGEMQDGGTTRLAPACVLNISGATGKGMRAPRVLENFGTVYWSGGTLYAYFSSVLYNRPGAVWEVRCDDQLRREGDTPVFYNEGLMRKTAASGTSLFSMPFRNSGTLEIQSGGIEFNSYNTSAFENSGAVTMAANTFLKLFTGTSSGAFNHGGNSVVEFWGNYYLVNGTTFTGPGRCRIASGVTVYLSGNVSMANLDMVDGNCYLVGPGALTISGVMNWTVGWLSQNSVTLNIATTGTLNVSGGAMYVNSTLNNSGRVVASGTGGLTVYDGAVINNLTGAVFELQGDGGLNNSGPNPVFNNAGLLRRSVSSGTVPLRLRFNNTGTMDVQSGTLFLDNPPLVNSGTITLGNGSISVVGNYNSAPSATVNIALSGPAPVSQYGRLHVTGQAALNGALNVSLANGFLPVVGDTFLVVSNGTRNGSFASTSGFDLGGGRRLALSYPTTPPGALLTTVTLGMSPGALPLGYAGAAYSQTLSGVNGVAPYEFAEIGGVLQAAGLSLSPVGVLSGTPAAPGVLNFTVQVTDAALNTATANYTMQVLSCGLAALNSDLVSQWHGDGNANDSAGSNHGTVQNGATFATGFAGQAFSFDGVNDYVAVPDSPSLSPHTGGEMSLEVWMYQPQLPQAVPPQTWAGWYVVGKGTEYGLLVGSGGEFALALWQQNYSDYGTLWTTGGVVATNRWQHFVGVLKKGQFVRAYVDGALVAERTSFIGNMQDGGETFNIGQLAGGFLKGKVDEVNLYRRALSSAEVAALHNSGAPSCVHTPEFTTPATLPNGRVGTPYWQTLSAVLGHPPLTFSGSLPPLTLSGSGLISGTPLVAGTITFTVTLTDVLGNTAQREFTLTVEPTLPCVTIDGAWARWPGEGSGAETINGFTGGLNNGVAFTPGVVGQAFLFDGVDDYVQASVPYLPGEGGGSSDKNCSIELWMKMDAPAPSGGSWVAGWGDPAFPSPVFALAVGGNQRLQIPFDTPLVGPVVEVGRWYHVVAVHESGYAKLYVDGALVANVASVFNASATPVYLGMYPPTSSRRFRGAIDEPTVFTRALSAAEVASIYAAGSAGKCASRNNTVPNGTCEVIASAIIGNHDVNIRGLAFDPWNQPVVAWQEGRGGWGSSTRYCRWTFRTNGVWNTPYVIQQSGSIGGPPSALGLTLRNDGVPFLHYSVDNIYFGNDSYGTGFYRVDGSEEPTGPGTLIHAFWENRAHSEGGITEAGFMPGASLPDYVYWRAFAADVLYNGVYFPNIGPPAGHDFSINNNGVRALIHNGSGGVRLSRTAGQLDGPLIIAASGRGNVAGTVDDNDVFHTLTSGLHTDADWANGKMVYARSTDGTNWNFTDFGPGVDFLGNNSSFSREVGIASAPNGRLGIAYYRVGTLWYAEQICGHWVQTAVSRPSGFGQGTELFRLAFDRNGQPAIAIYDPGTANVLLCRPAPLSSPGLAAVCRNISVNLDAAGQATIGALDVDGGSTAETGFANRSVTPSSFTCANLGANTVTLTVTDACGQSASCQAVVTVVDAMAPVIGAAGADATIDCPATPVFTPPGATDNCDPNPQIIEVSDVTTPGPCPTAYSRTKTWKARDASGNESGTVHQTITVRDVTPPVLSATPADAMVECHQVPAVPTITASDTCNGTGQPVFSEVRVNGACPNTYQLRRTWSATDVCGNNASYTQTITVRDTTPPVIGAAGADATIDCPATPVFTPPPATDNCDAAPNVVEVSDVTTPGVCAGAYARTKTWKAVDACGNESGTVSQTITVRDTTPPVLSASPADTTVECGQLSNAPTLTATDTCDANVSVSFSETRVDGNCANNYQLRRTWSATDACGNNISYTQTITVHDTTPPVLGAAGADATIDCPAIPVFVAPSATDNCDAAPSVVEVSDVTTPGACAGAYSRTRTWKARDTCGNESGTVSQTIIVRDATPPELSATPADLTAECHQVPAAPTITASDTCDPSVTVQFSQTRVDENCANNYQLRRTWSATDACGNNISHTQTITVRDTTPPVLGVAGANATIDCPATPVFAAPSAADNCDAAPSVVEVSDVTTPGACAGAYSRTKTWKGRDACGNESGPVSQTITVRDTTPPVLSAAGANTTINCPATPVFTAPTASDACDAAPQVVEVSDVTTPGACAGAYSRTKTWKAVDACGNESGTVSQTITVRDDTAPTLTVPANVTIECNGSTSPAATGIATASDACGIVTVTYTDIINGTCPGTITRTWTATDACNNSVSQTQTITRNADQSEPCPTYAFEGFLPPIDGADATGGSFGAPIRAFKLGSTIPVKFRILCHSAPVTNGVHTLQAVYYSAVTTSESPIDATPTDAATTGNQFRAAGDTWHFNLSTKAVGFKKGIWELVATLADGTQHVVWIEIKK